MKSIRKLATAKFEVTSTITKLDGRGTPYQTEEKLQLDFNPIINTLTEEEKFYPYKLIHWQAQPKGDREWGVYDSVDDSYMSSVFEDHDAIYGGSKLIMLNDSSEIIPLPSSVIYYVGSLPLARSTFSDVSRNTITPSNLSWQPSNEEEDFSQDG